eukprot:GHVO01004504.1.p1 GENE.GHVO01004504.1~~GHVO01004504.1.p1  ORF type:complete len:300 (+),score=59.79 GHVO01004504.1:31-930(+)
MRCISVFLLSTAFGHNRGLTVSTGSMFGYISAHPDERSSILVNFEYQDDIPPCISILISRTGIASLPPYEDLWDTCIPLRSTFFKYDGEVTDGIEGVEILSSFGQGPAPFAETGGVDLRRMSIRVDMDAPYTRLALAFFLPNGDPMYDVEVHVTEFRRQPMTVIVCILVTVIAIGALSLDNRILKLLSLVLPSERRLWIQEEYPTHTFQDINRNVEAVRIVSTHPKTVSEVVEMIPSLDTAGVLHCALCMRQFKGTDRVRFGGTCDYHLFHSTCVYRWIWSNGKRCPSCPPGKYPLRRM